MNTPNHFFFTREFLKHTLHYSTKVCFLFLTLVVFGAQSGVAQTNLVNIKQLGAAGDGKTLDTISIQQAIDQCGSAGGGVVEFPAGTYLSKPLSLWNKVTLRLDQGATLLASDDMTGYERSNAPNTYIAFIQGTDVSDVGIVGQGTIDGAGSSWWEQAKTAKANDKSATLPRPRLIGLNESKNITVSGVTLQNSPSFHLALMDCQNVTIQGVKISAPADSLNTDGINLNNCRNATITHCLVDVGGENVCVKANKPMPGHPSSSEDITTSDCTFLGGQGWSIGSETIGGVRNITLKNCLFNGTEDGIHIKSARDKGGITEGITCDSLTITNCRNPLIISCYNQGVPKTDEAKPLGEWTPIIRNITIKNVTASSQRTAGEIIGLPERAIQNVSLENVQISAAQSGLKIRDAKGVRLKNVRVSPKRGLPIIIDPTAEVQNLDSASK